MCSSHWAKLRQPIKDAIWREYRPGQEQDKKPSARYMSVQRLAVASLIFKPNDELAVATAAPYIEHALMWRKIAVESDKGDPLAGLIGDVVLNG